MILIFKIIFLFLAVAGTGVITVRVVGLGIVAFADGKKKMTAKNVTLGDLLIWAVGVVGFITCHWLI